MPHLRIILYLIWSQGVKSLFCYSDWLREAAVVTSLVRRLDSVRSGFTGLFAEIDDEFLDDGFRATGVNLLSDGISGVRGTPDGHSELIEEAIQPIYGVFIDDIDVLRPYVSRMDCGYTVNVSGLAHLANPQAYYLAISH